MQYLNILIIVIAIYMIAYSIYATKVVLVYHEIKMKEVGRIKNDYDKLRKYYEELCKKTNKHIRYNLSIREMSSLIDAMEEILYRN